MRKTILLLVVCVLFIAVDARADYIKKDTCSAGGGAGAAYATCSLTGTGASFSFIACSYYGGAIPADASDDQGNIYSGGGYYFVTNFYVLRVWWSWNITAAATMTMKCDGGGRTDSAVSIVAEVWSGSALSGPYDQECGTASTAVASLATGTCTPSDDGQLILSVVAWKGTPATFSVNSGLTIDENVDDNADHGGLTIASKVQSVAAAINVTWNSNLTMGIVEDQIDVATITFKKQATPSTVHGTAVKTDVVK